MRSALSFVLAKKKALFALSVGVAAVRCLGRSQRRCAVAVCVAVGWLLLLTAADFEWGRLRLNATRCHEKHLDGFRSASVCWQISDASAAKSARKTKRERKSKKNFQKIHSVQNVQKEKTKCLLINKGKNIYVM